MYFRLDDRIFPPGSRRRVLGSAVLKAAAEPGKLLRSIRYENIKKCIYYLRAYGPAFLAEKISIVFSETPLESRSGSGRPMYVPLPNRLVCSDVASKDAAVSIIIQTGNAGNRFHDLLTMARNQRGLKKIEIVVVDSGSDDNTVQTARDHGAKVLEIPCESSSLSFSRNLGAENASGDFLFFTAQDALFPSDTFIYEMLDFLEKKNVSAVSCAEFPREDADLFSSACCWHQHELLGVNGNDRILSRPECENPATLRRNGQLSDVACLIPRRLFLEYKYREAFPDGLDLGIRLIMDGRKTAFLSSVKVIHSHNNRPFYYLRRGYNEQSRLRSMFPDYPASFIDSAKLPHEIMVSLGAINILASCFGEGGLFPCKTEDLLRRVTGGLKNAYRQGKLSLCEGNAFIDGEMIDFLMVVGAKAAKDDPEGGPPLLLDAIVDFLKTRVFDFLRNSFESVDDELAVQVRNSIFSSFALVCGAYVADSDLQDLKAMLSTSEPCFHDTV